MLKKRFKYHVPFDGILYFHTTLQYEPKLFKQIVTNKSLNTHPSGEKWGSRARKRVSSLPNSFPLRILWKKNILVRNSAAQCLPVRDN